MDSTLLVTLEVARNGRNFGCARSQVAINTQIHGGDKTKHTLPTSMLCSSVVKAFFVPKRGTEIDEVLYVRICQKLDFKKSV